MHSIFGLLLVIFSLSLLTLQVKNITEVEVRPSLLYLNLTSYKLSVIIDILCVCEHWLLAEEIEYYRTLGSKGSNMFAHFCRKSLWGGGVAIFLKKLKLYGSQFG